MITTNLKYYAIQVEDNLEFSIQEKLSYIFPELETLIPVEKQIITIDGKRFLYQDRMMPEYILIGSDNLTSQITDKINKIKGVISILSAKIKGKSIPTELESSEVKRFIKKKPITDYLEVKDTVNILHGLYAGFEAKIDSIENDILTLTVEIKGTPVITLPVWYIGKQIEGDK